MTRTDRITEDASAAPWAERAADRSPAAQRARARRIEQTARILDAAHRLISERGEQFTTQELVTEAGVALQTFYRLFAGKDQLLLAVFGNWIAQQCARFEEAGRELADPIARLHFYVTRAFRSIEVGDGAIAPRFVTAEHWRLHQLFPDEMAEATQPYTDLIARELEEAAAAGLLPPGDAQRNAWFVTELVMAVFHHYAFVSADVDTEAIGEQLWVFCRTAVGLAGP